jgi:sulfur carrier protein ThiS
MRIYLDRYFNFYSRSRQPWVEVDFVEPARLSDVLENVGIPIAEVHLAVINGEAVDPHEIYISQKDQVKIYPPLGGG